MTSPSSSVLDFLAHPVSEMLMRENYLLWKAQVLPAVRGVQLMGYLDSKARRDQKPSRTWLTPPSWRKTNRYSAIYSIQWPAMWSFRSPCTQLRLRFGERSRGCLHPSLGQDSYTCAPSCQARARATQPCQLILPRCVVTQKRWRRQIRSLKMTMWSPTSSPGWTQSTTGSLRTNMSNRSDPISLSDLYS